MKNKSFITSEPFLITQILENQNPIHLFNSLYIVLVKIPENKDFYKLDF